MCVQRRFRSACPFAQSDHSTWHFWITKDASYFRGQQRLLRLRVCAGWVESSFGVHLTRYVFLRCGSIQVGFINFRLRRRLWCIESIISTRERTLLVFGKHVRVGRQSDLWSESRSDNWLSLQSYWYWRQDQSVTIKRCQGARITQTRKSKRQTKFIANDILLLLFYFFRENLSLYLMWIICLENAVKEVGIFVSEWLHN